MRRWTPVLAIALALIIVTGSYTARAIEPVTLALGAGVVIGALVMTLVSWAFYQIMHSAAPSGSGWDLIESTSVATYNAFAVANTNLANNLHVFNLTYTFYARYAESLVDQHAGAGGSFDEAWIEPVLRDITNWAGNATRDYITVLNFTAATEAQLSEYAADLRIDYYRPEEDRKVVVVTKNTYSSSRVLGIVATTAKTIAPDQGINFDVRCGNYSLAFNSNYLRQYIAGRLDCEPKVIYVGTGTEIKSVILTWWKTESGNTISYIRQQRVKTILDFLATAKNLYAQVKRMAEIRWQIVKDNADAVKTPPPSVLFWDPKQLEKLSPTERMYAYYAWLRTLSQYNWSQASEMTPEDVTVANLTGGIRLSDGSLWFPLYVPDTCTVRSGEWTAPFDIPSMVVYPNGTYRYVIVRNGTTLNITALPNNSTEMTLSPTTLEDWAELQGVLVEPEEPEVEEKDIDWTKIALYLGGALVVLLIGIPVLSGIGERLESTVAGIRPGTRPRGGRRGGSRRGRGGRRR